MTTIVRANPKDSQVLARIGKTTFIESHGNSAAASDINWYLNENYKESVFTKELYDLKNIYHLIYYDMQPAGYSKIIFNYPHANTLHDNVTKLERLYLLKEYYGLKLGFELLNFNIQLSKMEGQAGMWLFVWKENHRAVNFYKKNGFVIIGSEDFQISATHSNPNHQMFLPYNSN